MLDFMCGETLFLNHHEYFCKHINQFFYLQKETFITFHETFFDQNKSILKREPGFQRSAYSVVHERKFCYNMTIYKIQDTINCSRSFKELFTCLFASILAGVLGLAITSFSFIISESMSARFNLISSRLLSSFSQSIPFSCAKLESCFHFFICSGNSSKMRLSWA